jgi:hypothetical protein
MVIKQFYSLVLHIHNNTDIMGVTHIWLNTPFSLISQNNFILRFCFIHLKHNSACNHLLYRSVVSQLMVMNS